MTPLCLLDMLVTFILFTISPEYTFLSAFFFYTNFFESESVKSVNCNPMDYSPPGSSVHGILQARIVEWVAIYMYTYIPSFLYFLPI